MTDQPALEIWRRALDNPKGIAIRTTSQTAAIGLRFRLYRARKADRKTNEELYPPGHAMHGRSHFEDLTVVIEPGSEPRVLIQPRTEETFQIEEL
jgi:hypothetical protein